MHSISFSTANANANANNRIEYAIWNAFSGYYQKSNSNQATDGTFGTNEMLYDGAAGDPVTTTSPFVGWTAVGDTGGT